LYTIVVTLPEAAMSARIGMALALVAAAGCARGPKVESAPVPLPQDGPASELFFAQVNTRGSSLGDATLKFVLADSAYALVGQIRDGKIRVIFPASPEGTGWMNARDTMAVWLNHNGTGPIFLITRKKPIDFRLSGVGPYWADIGLEEYADTKDPIEGIRWYAAQVADTNYRVQIAGVAPRQTAEFPTTAQQQRAYPWAETVSMRGCTGGATPRSVPSDPKKPLCPRDP
jgi:hypothetical protein